VLQAAGAGTFGPRRLSAIILVVSLLVASPAGAGHEMTFYPSFYPQEISVRFVEPPGAAALLAKNALHAYAGVDAGGGARSLRHMESLQGYVVLTFRPGATAFAEAAARCAAAAAVGRALGPRAPFVAHPYAVTPYHDDFVHHFDLAQASGERTPGALPRISAGGTLGAALQSAGVARATADADAVLEEVSVSALRAPVETHLGGWHGPPWIKEGWFHAWLLHAPALPAAARRAAEELLRRRTELTYQPPAERVALERRLVSAASAGCERVVLGYTLRREPLNDDYSEGVENVAVDGQSGIATPIFVRTVKLKDFPWNGWLHTGTAPPARAAWNPIAGFTDDGGRMVWAAVGDPAMLLDPDNGRWIANRVRPVSVSEPGTAVDVPADALVPAAGELKAAGAGVTAGTKIVYRVLFSKFHDGQPMAAADLLFAYAFASREHDPDIDRATAVIRASLAAVRIARVDTEIRDLGDMKLPYQVPHVEVYLKPAADPRYAAALAPPWSPVPWQVLALMEQAVARGVGAYSEPEARRRAVPWLDLVRDTKIRPRLLALAADFERRAWVPEALREHVTAEQARARWRALREFHKKTGHVLVTAGPYQIGKHTAAGVTLPVFRDFSYPLGVGSFDQYPIPLHAYVRTAEQRGARLEIQADVEEIEKSGRSYKIVRGPFRSQPPTEKTREPLTAHWTVIGAGDEVAATGTSHDVQNGRLVVDLAGRLKPGSYRVLLALALNGNLVNPKVTVIPYRAGE
jgi:hypothetical protein